MGEIAINGKFLGANLNGVHRTAAHYSAQLIERAKNEHDVALFAPAGAQGNQDFPSLKMETLKGHFGSGQGWEMLTLARAARGKLLLNFCNLSPLLHNNSVVMIHDAQTFLHPEDYTGKQAVFYRLLLPLIAKRARRILTVSEFSRQSLAAHGIGWLDKIEVVHNGTDHILDVSPDEQILEKWGLKPQGYVLTLGSAKGYKNMRAVFGAMQEPLAGDMPLVVAGGPGKANYLEKGWTPPESALFTGFVSDGELRALYENAATFLFPSLTEGFGLPPVEAMHCNCPVVAARAGAMPEILADASILVRADDPAAYRQAAVKILSDAEFANGLRARGLQRAAELSWDKAGRRLYDIVQKLI